MENNERNLIISIIWKPLFTAIMTAILADGTEIHPVIIGSALGIASSMAGMMKCLKIVKSSGINPIQRNNPIDTCINGIKKKALNRAFS